MTVRFKICLAVWIVTVAGSIACNAVRADEFDTGDGWVMEVMPAVRTSEAAAIAAEIPPAVDAGVTTVTPADSLSPVTGTPGEDYRRIYQSIPFNRAEYNVNPSYRHDTAMEILTGNSRHQTVVQHSTMPVARERLRSRVLPYRYNNYRRGLNYYFYFPYWNYRGIY